MKVAICDDSEQDIADLKEKLLKIIEGQIENCEIHVYTDVTKFLKEIHTISFDGIFLDIDMPQMTGIQAAQQVREVLPDVERHHVFLLFPCHCAISLRCRIILYGIIKQIS